MAKLLLAHGLAEDAQTAGIRFQEMEQELDGGGLARPVGAEKTEDLALGYGKVKMVRALLRLRRVPKDLQGPLISMAGVVIKNPYAHQVVSAFRAALPADNFEGFFVDVFSGAYGNNFQSFWRSDRYPVNNPVFFQAITPQPVKLLFQGLAAVRVLRQQAQRVPDIRLDEGMEVADKRDKMFGDLEKMFLRHAGVSKSSSRVYKETLSFFSAPSPFLISRMSSASHRMRMVSRQLANSSGLTNTATGVPFLVITTSSWVVNTESASALNFIFASETDRVVMA
jgi:hypothetical protein